MGRPNRTAYENPLINKDGTISVRSCCVNDLTVLYGVSYKTMRSWLKPFAEEIGLRKSFMFTPKQVEHIFKKLGTPKSFDFDKYTQAA